MILRSVALAVSALALSSCTMLGLNYASLETDNKAKPTPPISVDSVAEWELEADRLREVFADYMYGTWPTGLEVSFGPTRIADSNYFGGRGILEETPITLGSGAGARTFHLAVAYPKSAEGAGPMPMVISQNFSNNCPVFQSTSLTRPDGNRCTEDDVVFGGFVGWAVTSVFGEYIAKAPIEQYFDRGIAIANFYASEIVPDNEDAAEQVMAGLQREPGITSNSAIAYWSYGFSAAIDLFEEDARVDKSRIAVWGHSRHGKSALVAGAWDKRISMIVSHQSGFGGAALNRSRKGERIDRVVDSYPHWFTPKLGDYVENPGEMPFDQHQLVALNAPRPVFLGNGRRDVWSDPNSTYRAALEADKIWELYGSEGLDQAGLQDYNPAGDLAYQLRKGGHGVTPTDIDDFMRFYDAHWGTSAATP